MVELTHNIVEANFNKDKTQQHLSVLLGTDRFSFFIAQEQDLLLFRQYQLPKQERPSHAIQQILRSDALLHEGFARVRIGYESPLQTLVPQNLWHEGLKTQLLPTLFPLQGQEQSLSYNLLDWNLQLLYALDAPSHRLLEQHFPQAKHYPANAGLLKLWQPLAQNQQSQVFVHLQGQWLQISLFQEGKLWLHNHFPIKTSQDCLYYLLLVCREYKISTQKLKLIASGNWLEDSELYNTFLKYIYQVQFVDYPHFYRYGPKLRQELPAQCLVDLLSLSLCES